jgi:hypothetical protein
MELIQKTPIGKVLVELDSQELLMLKLLMCHENEIKQLWKSLWATVADYEDLHFFCKEFMPTVVARLNRHELLDELMPFINGNSHFIRGFSKFFWLKNQIILREARQVSVFFSNAGIDFSFFKGVGRMLEVGGSDLYRISRDIDLLVPWDQFDQSIELLLKSGWKFKDKVSRGEMLIIGSNSITLYHHIHKIDIDLHRSLFHDSFNKHLPLMKKIWGRAKASGVSKHLFILSKRDQILVAIKNAFNLFNWETSQFCKYIYDITKILQEMNDEDLKELHKDLDDAKLTAPFFQILSIIKYLEINLPWQNLPKYQNNTDLVNFLANFNLIHKNAIVIQGEAALNLLSYFSTIKLIWTAIKKNPLRFLTYFYFLIKKGFKLINRILKKIYYSIFSIEQQTVTSIFKNRIRLHLFS